MSYVRLAFAVVTGAVARVFFETALSGRFTVGRTLALDCVLTVGRALTVGDLFVGDFTGCVLLRVLPLDKAGDEPDGPRLTGADTAFRLR